MSQSPSSNKNSPFWIPCYKQCHLVISRRFTKRLSEAKYLKLSIIFIVLLIRCTEFYSAKFRKLEHFQAIPSNSSYNIPLQFTLKCWQAFKHPIFLQCITSPLYINQDILSFWSFSVQVNFGKPVINFYIFLFILFNMLSINWNWICTTSQSSL